MEYFRRCIGQANMETVNTAIKDVLTESGFIYFASGYEYNYKKYSVNNIDFCLHHWGGGDICCILKSGVFNSDGMMNDNNFVMSSTIYGWEGNNTLNFIFLP